MRKQFVITKSFFHFLVTIQMGQVAVETGMPCRYKKDSCDVFAKTHESILSEYLKRQKAGNEIYDDVVNYHSQKQWLITEL